MADKKITQLPSLSFISGSTTGYYAGEVVLPIVHNSTTVKMEAQKFALYATQWSATTASNTFIGNQTVNGNVVITGKLTAQEMHTEITSASIIFESGSTLFGNSADDTHTFTGTININGNVVGNAPLDFTSQSLNVQTGSQELINLGISSVTGSMNTQSSSQDSVNYRNSTVSSSLNFATASLNFTTGALNIASGSYNRFYQVTSSVHSTTASLNQATSSLNFASGALNIATGSYNRFYDMTSSVHFTTQSLNVQTGSQELINVQNSTVSSSLNFASASINFTTGALNSFTGSIISQTNTIATFTSSVNFATASLNTQTGSQDLVNFRIASTTGSINTTTSSFDSVFLRISSVTGSMNTQSSSQDLVNYQNSIVTSSFRNEIGGIEAYTASLKNAITVNGTNVQIIGDLNVNKLNVQYVSSSVLVTSGSNTFGDQSTDKHEFTGSVAISGPLYVNDVASTLQIVGNGFGQSSLISPNGALVLTPGLYGVQINGTYPDLQANGNITANGSVTGNIIATNNVVSSSTQVQNYDVFALNSNLYTSTGSLIGITNGLMALTASMKAAAIVSSSQQIKDYITFVNNDVTSSMNVNSASIAYKATNVVGAANRIIFNNATDTTTTSANLTWDGSKLSVNGNIAFGYASTLQNTNDPTNNISLHDGSFGIMAFRNGGVDKITTYRGVGSVVKISGSLVVDSNSPTAKHEITGSVEVNGNIVGSLLATNGVVSSSQQIQNYNTFAKTGSANIFYGTQTITGSLNVGVGTSDNTAGDLFVDTANKTVYVGRQSSTSGDNTIFAVRNRVSSLNALYVDAGGNGKVEMTGSLEVTRGVKLGTATGNVEVIGNLVMSTAGNGIDFSANSNAAGMTSELLNDYEEGTWTPIASNTSTATGVYTKIGRLVTAQAHVIWNGVGAVSLNGLPFATSAAVYAGSIYYQNIDLPANTIQMIVVNDASSTYISGYTLYDDGAWAANPVTKNGSEVYITLQYTV